MPKSAIPKHVLERDWKGTDNDSWLMRLKKKIQYVFAAGPNVPSGFWKWREYPITLIVMRGAGELRYENSDGTDFAVSMEKTNFHYRLFRSLSEYDLYLSRIQPWCRWHISLQWPLFFNCHFIYRAKDVVKYPEYKSAFGIKKMFTFGIGFKRDGDKVYWLTANLGGNFE